MNPYLPRGASAEGAWSLAVAPERGGLPDEGVERLADRDPEGRRPGRRHTVSPHGRAEKTGADRVDPDVGGPELLGQRLGEADHGELRRGIAGGEGPARLPGDRRDVHDRARAPCSELGERGLGDQHHALDVHRHHAVELRLGELRGLDRHVLHHARHVAEAEVDDLDVVLLDLGQHLRGGLLHHTATFCAGRPSASGSRTALPARGKRFRAGLRDAPSFPHR